jgi:hypothetical protein
LQQTGTYSIATRLPGSAAGLITLQRNSFFDRDQARPGINQIAWDRLGNGAVHQY